MIKVRERANAISFACNNFFFFSDSVLAAVFQTHKELGDVSVWSSWAPGGVATASWGASTKSSTTFWLSALETISSSRPSLPAPLLAHWSSGWQCKVALFYTLKTIMFVHISQNRATKTEHISAVCIYMPMCMCMCTQTCHMCSWGCACVCVAVCMCVYVCVCVCVCMYGCVHIFYMLHWWYVSKQIIFTGQ